MRLPLGLTAWGQVVVYRCEITEEINGNFALEMEVAAQDADKITEGRIIVADTHRGRQPFRIHRTEKISGSDGEGIGPPSVIRPFRHDDRGSGAHQQHSDVGIKHCPYRHPVYGIFCRWRHCVCKVDPQRRLGRNHGR